MGSKNCGRSWVVRAGPFDMRCGFVLVGLLSSDLSAQVVGARGPSAASYKPSADQRPTTDAMQLAGRVNAAVKSVCGANCPEVAVFRNDTAAQVMLIASGGQAKLV